MYFKLNVSKVRGNVKYQMKKNKQKRKNRSEFFRNLLKPHSPLSPQKNSSMTKSIVTLCKTHQTLNVS